VENVVLKVVPSFPIEFSENDMGFLKSVMETLNIA
jgi:hypothetical protein